MIDRVLALFWNNYKLMEKLPKSGTEFLFAFPSGSPNYILHTII